MSKGLHLPVTMKNQLIHVYAFFPFYYWTTHKGVGFAFSCIKIQKSLCSKA